MFLSGIIIGLFLGLLLGVISLYLFKRIIANKGDNKDGSRNEFLFGKMYTIITEEEYCDYILFKNKGKKNEEADRDRCGHR